MATSTNVDAYISYNYKKLSRLSHEGLLIPLIYWSSVPKHIITAILVHKSLHFGEVIVTGSSSGEFVIWKPISSVNEEEEEEDDDDDDKSEIDCDSNIEWIAIAMTFSSNTTAITSIIGLITYRDETSFAALHRDGELEIYSLSGCGTLKICRSERPILHNSAVGGIFPYKKSNVAYKYMLCTNYYNDCIHLIELNKAKQVREFFLSECENASSIVDLVFLNDKFIMETFVCIDSEGNMGIFRIDINNEFEVIEPMQCTANWRNTPIRMDITLDDRYIAVISMNEFVVYCLNDWKLLRIASKTERNVHWNGMLIFDRYFDYKMLPDLDFEEEHVQNDDSVNIYNIDHPFFVFLWEYNARSVKLYIVSKENTSILVPIVELIVFSDEDDAVQWNVMSNDDEYIYIATFNGGLISYSISRVKETIIDCYKHETSLNDVKIRGIRGNVYCGNIGNSFDHDRKRVLYNDDDENGSDDIMCCCLNLTNCGVLLCLGYRSGLVYVYNVTSSAPLLEIHTKTECISCLLLLCLNDDSPHENDGILFIGYCDGVIEIFNIYSNLCLFNKQCHCGAVSAFYHFFRDYYVFSLGRDNAVCSYLVYSEIATMKGIMDELAHDEVAWCYYRGDCGVRIVSLYRNEWCLENDYLVMEADCGDMFVWSVATAQMERCLNERDAILFKSDRAFYVEKRRNDIVNNLSSHHQLYNIHSLNTSHLNANIVILDILSIFKSKQYQIEDIIRVLSLLLDWDIMTETFNNSFCDSFNSFLSAINYKNNSYNTNPNSMTNECDLYNLSLIKDIQPCFGFIGDYNSMTMLFPVSSSCGGKWKMHTKFSSIYMLSISMLCIYLKKQIRFIAAADDDDHETITHFVTKELIHFYSVLLPQNLSHFVEPSRTVVSRCCLSSTSSLRKTARILLENMVKRMSANVKKQLVSKWKNNMQKLKDDADEKIAREYPVFRRLTSRSRSRTKLNPNNTTTDYENENDNHGSNHRSLSILFNAILICIISETTTRRDVDLDDTVTLSVITNLTAILNECVQHKSDVIKKSLCCFYLGKVINTWFKPHDATYTSLFVALLNILLDLCTDYDDAKSQNGNILSESAMYALIECGTACPQLFIQTMGTEALQISKRFRHRKAMQCMQRLIYTAPLSLVRYLPFMVKQIIQCLDPSSPLKRKSLLKTTTSTLHELVHKFPNCSFHAKTQHFALSTRSTRQDAQTDLDASKTDYDYNCVIIYDLRTATRFGKGLKHESPITAIEFNHNGTYLISYSPFEEPPVLCIWKMNANDGLFGFFSSQSKCIKIVQLPKLNSIYSTEQHLTNTQITWDTNNQHKVTLQREDESCVRFEIS